MTVLHSGLYYGKTSRFARVPELMSLQNAKIAIYGVGAIGAVMAIEFARIGIELLHLIDHDKVDPAGTCRWPLGISVAGRPKVEALKGFISTNYPFTRVNAISARIGGVELRPNSEPPHPRPNDWDQMLAVNRGLDLVIDATAEFAVQQCLAFQLAELGVRLGTV